MPLILNIKNMSYKIIPETLHLFLVLFNDVTCIIVSLDLLSIIVKNFILHFIFTDLIVYTSIFLLRPLKSSSSSSSLPLSYYSTVKRVRHFSLLFCSIEGRLGLPLFLFPLLPYSCTVLHDFLHLFPNWI